MKAYPHTRIYLHYFVFVQIFRLYLNFHVSNCIRKASIWTASKLDVIRTRVTSEHVYRLVLHASQKCFSHSCSITRNQFVFIIFRLIFHIYYFPIDSRPIGIHFGSKLNGNW